VDKLATNIKNVPDWSWFQCYTTINNIFT